MDLKKEAEQKGLRKEELQGRMKLEVGLQQVQGQSRARSNLIPEMPFWIGFFVERHVPHVPVEEGLSLGT